MGCHVANWSSYSASFPALMGRHFTYGVGFQQGGGGVEEGREEFDPHCLTPSMVSARQQDLCIVFASFQKALKMH